MTEHRPGELVAAVAAAGPATYEVAIPSYRRPDELGAKTLTLLETYGADPERVTVFVATPEEEELYRAMLAAREGPSYRVVVGRPGLLACRQWYLGEHYPAGTLVLSVDDDLTGLVERTEDGKVRPYVGTLDELATIGFRLAEAAGTTLWGIGAVANGFYMKDEAVIGLRYVCGGFFGITAGDPVLVGDDRPPVSSGEDFLTSVRAFETYGGAARVNWIALRTTVFTPGGMQDELGGAAERDADHRAVLQQIAAKYPHLATLVTKAGGMINIRFKPRTSARVGRAVLERAVATPTPAEPQEAEEPAEATGQRVEYRRPSELRVAEVNPKGHAEEELQASLTRWGYTEPIIEDSRTGRLVAGHGRRQMLMDAEARGADLPDGIRLSPEGWWLAPVVVGWASTTDEEAETFLLASNRLVELGQWDEQALAADLAREGIEATGLGRAARPDRSGDPAEDNADREDSYGERRDKYDKRTAKRFVFDLLPAESRAVEEALARLGAAWGTDRPTTALRAVTEAAEERP